MSDQANQPLLLCASPRRGNSLEAARLFASGFNEAAGKFSTLKPVLLSDNRIEPCIDCGACSKGKPCPFLNKDDSDRLLEAFLHAPFIALSAPIYFYHLPAQLKALLDRCQQYYAWRELGLEVMRELPERKAFVMLSAAREKGSQLFTGSLLTLKLALLPFNISLEEPLEMRGLDQPGDLSSRQDYQEALLEYGRKAARSLQMDKA